MILQVCGSILSIFINENIDILFFFFL